MFWFKMASVNTCYTSAGCNRCPFSADWGRNGLICYGFNRAVAVYQPEGLTCAAGIIATLVGHTDRVNCVSWVANGLKDETELISGSADGTAVVWSYDKGKAQYEAVCKCKGHEGSVTCVSATNILANNSMETLIVTASIDSTVRISSRLGREQETKEQQVLHFGSGFALVVATYILPGLNVPALAFGCDDHNIHLYIRGDDKKFTKVLVLPGHEDWIRALHFSTDDNGDILLASCAQDNLIRVWRFKRSCDPAQSKGIVKSIADMSPDEDLAVKETIFSFSAGGQEVSFAVSLESVLCGHENWVYSVRWQPAQIRDNGLPHQPMKLLSASMDKTMILWSPDKETGMWIEQVRVGDVGGNTLGFFGGLFSPCGKSVLAHGYQGAFNQWSYNEASGMWEPQVTGGGHFDSVVDLAWSGGGGDYILTTSIDQTTRLHAPWVRETQKPAWYELARPQVHGYDLQCLSMLGRYTFASGADEKLVRVFKAPRNFITNFCHICGHSVNKELELEECLSLPEGANVPALGLSNKAVYGGGDADGEKEKEEVTKPGQYPENYFHAVDLIAPPSEDMLLQNTLWPEEAKLYGHGYEIFSLAAHPNGKLLASACKAAKADAANILLWDMETKRIIGSLSGCTLTVTQMAFNHKGDHLLAVSRDRSWALFKQSGSGQYVLKASVDKRTSSHSRIIWSCAWSHDDKFFFTASRDKKVLVWSVDTSDDTDEKSPPKPVASLLLENAVTAVSVAPVLLPDNRFVVAAGLDDGQILIYKWSLSGSDADKQWELSAKLNHSEAHHLTVTRLAFRPQTGRLGHQNDISNWLQLASSGADHAVHVYDIDLTKL